MRQGKIPLRRCTGCYDMKNKKSLIRVVRTEAEDGTTKFLLDASGKMSGRGAYLCPDSLCFEKARKQKGLERSFKQAIPEEVYEQLSQMLPDFSRASES